MEHLETVKNVNFQNKLQISLPKDVIGEQEKDTCGNSDKKQNKSKAI